jgi:hypothetical protein
VDGNGVDDFIIIDAILQNENRVAPTPDDLGRWADGILPRYGINGWTSGRLEFPVVSDGDWAIFNQYYPVGGGVLPSNVIIGADYVLDFFEPGWGGTTEEAAICCIEKNLCEGLPSDFVIPATGTRCDGTFDCQVFDNDLGTWRPVCTD